MKQQPARGCRGVDSLVEHNQVHPESLQLFAQRDKVVADCLVTVDTAPLRSRATSEGTTAVLRVHASAHRWALLALLTLLYGGGAFGFSRCVATFAVLSRGVPPHAV